MGTSGNDTIVGHGAHELIDYSNATSAVTLDLTQQGVQNSTGFVGNSSISGISDVIGASGFVNILTGTTGDNSLRGGNLADTLDGGGGNDTIGGGAGADVITYHGTEGVIDGGAETNPGLVSPNTLVIAADALVNKPGLAVDLSNSLDQTSGDATFTLNFQNIDASAATTSSSFSRLRPVTMTLAPSRAASQAVACPIPLPPPETRTVCPASRSGAKLVGLAARSREIGSISPAVISTIHRR